MADNEEIEDIIQENDQEYSETIVNNVPGTEHVSTLPAAGHLRGMFRNWFLDYASYVILDRAIPDISDGLKPVHRRILHSMFVLDDSRFNKVANIVGNAMQYHPHGDQSIYDALVTLGQKELLIETQGNWGNTLTGARAAAARYIEARLSPFALDVLFSPKVTRWTLSYDGRKKEPIVLPSKFPILLYHGVEGIAVGLSTKILPHNFNEIIDAAIAYLQGQHFTLLPDFPTGGLIDVSKYNDGARGGTVRIRARIEKIDNKTLSITEIPYGTTTEMVEESILKAFEKGKIKIRKVEDYTAENANIIIHLLPGTSSDKTIDALYAFTNCEITVYPNCCVIKDDKPHFLSISEVLKYNVDSAKEIIGKELEIKLGELREQHLFASLEKIFIEQRIYKDREFEEASDMPEASAHIKRRLKPFLPQFFREITEDDIARLMEIKMARILKFNSKKADENLLALQKNIEEVEQNLKNLTAHTIKWFRSIKKKYGEQYPRHTQIRNFENIEAANVAERNEKLYINREDGFIGTALKKDEFLFNCSPLDDIILFYKDGRYKIVRVPEKLAIDKNILYISVFKKNDKRTIYNVIYQNGKGGTYYMKRFFVTGLTRDKEYNLTPGLPGTRIRWFSANPNGEAEIVKVKLKPKPKLKVLHLDVDFSQMAIKGRQSMGNIVTRNEVHDFSLKEKGASTLGGRKVWFDPDVLRINYDNRGEYLGEFQGNDQILVILESGEFYTTGFNEDTHFEDNILKIIKFVPDTVWSAVVDDADQGNHFLKRFTFEASNRKQRFIGENPQSSLVLLTNEPFAQIKIIFGGKDSGTEPQIIDVENFTPLRTFKARGKKLSSLPIAQVIEIEPKEVRSDDSETEEISQEDMNGLTVEDDDGNIQEVELDQQQILFSQKPENNEMADEY